MITSSASWFALNTRIWLRPGIGDKETIVIVHGQADDANEVAMGFVLDQLDFASLRVEYKDSADFLIGDIQVAFGIHRHPIGLSQLPENFAAIGLGRCAGQAIHPGVLLRLGSVDLREFFRGVEGLVADTRDSRRVRPDDVRVIDHWGRLLRLVFLFLCRKNRQWRREHQA